MRLIAFGLQDAISAQIEECSSQINSYEAKKDQLETILRDNEESARLQREKEKLEKLLIAEKANLEEKIALFFKEFSNGALAFFSQSLVRRTSEFLKEVKVDDKGVVDLTAPTILELLRRGRCICGAEITEGNDAYCHLKEELAYVPPENIGNTVRHYRDKLSIFSRSADTTYDSITNRYAEIHRLMDRIQDMEDDLQRISESIKDTENMAQYEADLLDTKKRLRELNAKKERLIRDDGSYKQTIDSCQKLYDSLVAVSGKNKQIMELISYADSVREWFATTYKEKEHDIREQLEDKVNAIFERMYHGHRRVAIDMRYQVSLLTTIADREVAAGESEGSNRVKNFAFIAGLVALAKEKIIADSGEAGIPIPTEPYPLVMDAPFSNADETHTANISKVLPEVAEQVIMFVMQKDWNYAQPVMASKIGATYHLQMQSETYTVLNQGGLDMFDRDYTITGKHATFLKFLAVKNSKEDEADVPKSSAKLLERYIDVYMNAAVWGILYSKRAPKDTESKDRARIYADAYSAEHANCEFLYRLVMLLDESVELTPSERVDRAFRYDSDESKKEEAQQCMELFHEYVRGGLELMYEQFTDGCINRIDYMERVYEVMTTFKREYEGFSYDEALAKLMK